MPLAARYTPKGAESFEDEEWVVSAQLDRAVERAVVGAKEGVLSMHQNGVPSWALTGITNCWLLTMAPDHPTVRRSRCIMTPWETFK